MMDAEQLTLDGLAPRKRRKRAPAAKTPAAHLPVAQVVLDVQATHLGQTFDYLIEKKQSAAAQPGTLVRVRFGGQRLNGIIWNRADTSDTPSSALRYIERVITPDVLVPQSMRDDITAIADAYGGTRANILRMAVPPRVAHIEQEQRNIMAMPRDADSRRRLCQYVADDLFNGVSANYANASLLRGALQDDDFQSFVCNPLPGAIQWQRDLTWITLQALAAGKPAVIALPGMREVNDLMREFVMAGLRPFAPVKAEKPNDDGGLTGNSADGFVGYDGDVAILTAAMPPAERYRAYLAVTTGQARCVIGTRAVMYAPVEGPALFAIVDDAAYQNADGMMPYANARGVMRLRAKLHDGVFVAMANARSVISQWECSGGHAMAAPVSGYSTLIKPFPAVAKERVPWVRWLNREELARLNDSSLGTRVPQTAVRALTKALERGPVLLSIPQDGVTETLSCSRCHRQARCPRCTGPLERRREGDVRCRWCGAATVRWQCQGCGNERMRVVRVGAAGTAQELRGLFRNAPIVVSTPNQPRGIVEEVAFAPMLVIATPGAEPRVRGERSDGGEYSAVAILDAWTSLYALGMDARLDVLSNWMRVVSMCAPRSRGGQALLLGESDPVLAESLMLWDSGRLATQEVSERIETGLPPACAAACVWGQREAVRLLLQRIGALDGEWASVQGSAGAMPAVLGPVPIPPPKTVDSRELEGTDDRVKAVVRVSPSYRAELALRLRRETARHVAAREPGELRFQLDPKDLI